MRVDVGVKESCKKKLARADAQKVEGKWRRGTPKLRWRIALNVT